MLSSILRREKEELHSIDDMDGRNFTSKNTENIGDDWSDSYHGDVFEVFSTGTDFWFFYCGNTR